LLLWTDQTRWREKAHARLVERFVGLQVLAPAAAPLANVTVDVDSIKCSTHPPADITFATSVDGLMDLLAT
jgi:hypothetical protein